MTRPTKPKDSLAVTTPLGVGQFQVAKFQKRDQWHYIVRLPVTPEVAAHLADANCLTHAAKHTALFTFTAAELGIEDDSA